MWRVALRLLMLPVCLSTILWMSMGTSIELPLPDSASLPPSSGTARAAGTGNPNLNAFISGVSSPLNTALLQAIRKGDAAQVGQLLNQGASPNSQTENGEYAISVAAQSPVTSVIQGMTTSGVCVHIEKHFGYKPIVSALVAYGAKVNVRDRQKWSPLDQAKSFEETEVVTLLEKAGAH